MAQSLPSTELKTRIITAVSKVVDYIYTENIQTIILSGARAGLYYRLFRILWNKKYPSELGPRVISIGHINRNRYTPKIEEHVSEIRDKLIESGLKRNTQNVLVFDETIESGETLWRYGEALKQLDINPKFAAVFGLATPRFREPRNIKVFVGSYLESNPKLYNEFIAFHDRGRQLTAWRHDRDNHHDFFQKPYAKGNIETLSRIKRRKDKSERNLMRFVKK